MPCPWWQSRLPLPPDRGRKTRIWADSGTTVAWNVLSCGLRPAQKAGQGTQEAGRTPPAPGFLDLSSGDPPVANTWNSFLLKNAWTACLHIPQPRPTTATFHAFRTCFRGNTASPARLAVSSHLFILFFSLGRWHFCSVTLFVAACVHRL